MLLKINQRANQCFKAAKKLIIRSNTAYRSSSKERELSISVQDQDLRLMVVETDGSYAANNQLNRAREQVFLVELLATSLQPALSQKELHIVNSSKGYSDQLKSTFEVHYL